MRSKCSAEQVDTDIDNRSCVDVGFRPPRSSPNAEAELSHFPCVGHGRASHAAAYQDGAAESSAQTPAAVLQAS